MGIWSLRYDLRIVGTKAFSSFWSLFCWVGSKMREKMEEGLRMSCEGIRTDPDPANVVCIFMKLISLFSSSLETLRAGNQAGAPAGVTTWAISPPGLWWFWENPPPMRVLCLPCQDQLGQPQKGTRGQESP